MKEYNKLVRDRIPEFLDSSGKRYEVRRVRDEAEHIALLEAKVMEEWCEYNESGKVEELADLMQVIFSLAELRGVCFERLLGMACEKAEMRGIFEEGVVLVRCEE